ncbi:hypothetical protein CCR75_001940 [Bremia lactucae]|uniref:Uncharacterized protein n=1 Tax=Bremia lactucae TaxID=4779 RepID=A0A976FR25_BRELC|nr:hypothetical protein CCR75_001940 [Bremia lactucae]
MMYRCVSVECYYRVITVICTQSCQIHDRLWNESSEYFGWVSVTHRVDTILDDDPKKNVPIANVKLSFKQHYLSDLQHVAICSLCSSF